MRFQVHICMSQGESFPNLHGQLDVTGLTFQISDAPSSLSVSANFVSLLIYLFLSLINGLFLGYISKLVFSGSTYIFAQCEWLVWRGSFRSFWRFWN